MRNMIPKGTEIHCSHCGKLILVVVRDIPDMTHIKDTLDYCEGAFNGCSRIDLCPLCGKRIPSIVTQLAREIVPVAISIV